VRGLFLNGYLQRSQEEAARGEQQYRISNPLVATEFYLLEAEAMLWRGLYPEALSLLSSRPKAQLSRESEIRQNALEGLALTRLQDFEKAEKKLGEAERLCNQTDLASCIEVPGTRGVMAMERGQLPLARKLFLTSLEETTRRHDPWLEATARLNLGVVFLQEEHFDEALDWSKSALDSAIRSNSQDIAQVALGNLGWAYFALGDSDNSLKLFSEAEKHASTLGDVLYQIKWLTTSGYVLETIGNSQQGLVAYKKAFALASSIDSKDDIVTLLELLAQCSIDTGDIQGAGAYINQATPFIRISGNRLDELDILLAQGRIAAVRREDKQAETIFATVMHDPASQTSMRLGAGHELAKLYEAEGNPSAAERTYKATLVTFEAARDELKKEDSKLPFLANATRIYDDYISFLARHGRVEEALAAADSSRAQTLEQGLGIGVGRDARRGNPRGTALARSTGATLLFYWLGEKQSYLWAVTPERTRLFTLPSQHEIADRVKNYRNALLGMKDPIEAGNEDGRALYQMLVAPASDLIRPDAHVIVLADGELSKLNFETLIVPGPHPHYWIEDATLLSAPSLRMMANAQPARAGSGKLLLMGNAVSAGPEYPELPMAATEMKLVAGRFSSTDATVFSRAQANAESYLASKPEQFGYIHFVTHAVASSTDPLDSAILLSRSKSGEDGFKLYARQILTRPIHARLVTISACYGSGMRSYAGEGLVGLSWAFLRAGAHHVIGALWEVSDDSTPRLMDALYQGLQGGQTPAAALRHAKLLLLHSKGNFRKPFYWAPFQIYSGL